MRPQKAIDEKHGDQKGRRNQQKMPCPGMPCCATVGEGCHSQPEQNAASPKPGHWEMLPGQRSENEHSNAPAHFRERVQTVQNATGLFA